MAALLELDGVSKRYGVGRRAAVALGAVSLGIDADRPSIIAVVGESGSGKSTLGGLILGLLAPSSGRIRFRGTEVGRMDRAARRQFRRDVQAIPQDPFSAYNPFYLVDHALSMPIRRFGLAHGRAQVAAMIEEACANVGLNPAETLGRFPHQLSGGQRQRLMVARALLLKPRLLVADEPVSMVDASLRATILGNIADLNRQHGIAVVYITHDLTTAYHVADAVVVLYKGHVVEAGDVETVIRQPQHPYTRLLVDSIPWPDLSIRWGALPLSVAAAVSDGGAGCPFRARCPSAYAACAAPPPTSQVGSTQAVACHLFVDRPRLDPSGLDGLLRSATGSRQVQRSLEIAS